MYSLHRIIVSLFLFFFLLRVSAENPLRSPAGADVTGMGSVCISKTGFWSTFRNQALLAKNKSLAAGILYQNRFGLAELGTKSSAIIIPAGGTSLGIIYSQSGFHEFSRRSAGVACGLSLSEKISAGVQIDYLNEKTSGEYRNNQMITFEAGIVVKASENTIVGFHIFNPVPDAWRESAMRSVLTAGAGINLNKVLFAGAEIEMISGQKLLVRTGFEYEVAQKFWLRGGFCTENGSFSFGLGYLLKSVRIDLTFATHERLGVTSSISVVYKIH